MLNTLMWIRSSHCVFNIPIALYSVEGNVYLIVVTSIVNSIDQLDRVILYISTLFNRFSTVTLLVTQGYWIVMLDFTYSLIMASTDEGMYAGMLSTSACLI